MKIKEHVHDLVKEKYKMYDITIPIDKLPWSGEYVDVTLNDGTLETVDRMVEFTLCKMYSFYYIDRYGWTLDPIKGPIPLKLYDFQHKFLDDFQKHSKIIFRKSRQVGASVVTGAYALWRANFNMSQFIKIISLTKEDALEFKEKTIDINYQRMPGFMKSKHTRDGNSKMKLKLENGSHIKVLPKSKDAGRGGTPSLVIIDEAAFNIWMSDIWKAIEPSLDKGGSIIVISTTNGVGNWYHTTWTNAEQELNEFHTIFIPWWRYPNRSNPWLDKTLEDIKDEKLNPKELDDYILKKQNEQLAYVGSPKEAPWLWKRRHNAESFKVFQQEILAEFLGSGDTVVTFETILRIMDEVRDPIMKNKLPNRENDIIKSLWIWKEVKEGHSYILTSDTATGHGKDYSTFEIIDLDSNEQVAEYKNQIPTDTMGMLIKKVAIYYNNAYVIIECNHPGPAVFNEVYKSRIDPYHNVYTKMKAGAPWGWDTTAKSRNQLIDDYFKDLERGHTKLYSKRLLEEIKTFVWQDNGKAEAMRGHNDDLIITWAMYAHLKEKVYGSRPIGIATPMASATDGSGNNFNKWAEMDSKYQANMGISYDEYCWLQGKRIDPGYKKYKQSLQEMDNPSFKSKDINNIKDWSNENQAGLL